MQYFQIILFAALVIAVAVRIDAKKIKKYRLLAEKSCEEFLKFFDSLVSHSTNSDVHNLAYRGRILWELAENLPEKVAAIHILMGAAQTMLETTSPTDIEKRKTVDDLGHKALAAMANLSKIENEGILSKILRGKGAKFPDPETVKKQKAILLTRFSKKFGEPFVEAK